MNTNQNPFSIWAEMNKQMVDAWSSWTKSMPNPFTKETSGSSSDNPLGSYYDFLTKTYTDSMRNMSAFIPNPTVKEGFDRVLDSFKIFDTVQNYWDNVMKNIPTDMKDWETFSKHAMQSYQNVTQTLTSFLMPGQMVDLFSGKLEHFSATQQTVMELFKPWIEESSILQSLFIKALQGDKQAYKDFILEWAKIYRDSASKVLNIPTLGANRVSAEKAMKLLDDYIKFSSMFAELNSIISEMMMGAMERLLKHLAELHAEGKQPQTFTEFITLWSAFNERAFADMYLTEEFARIMNETLSAYAKMQIMLDDFMQDVLSFLPIPNRRELDDVGQEVYKLRKSVKSLEKELKTLKSTLGRA